MPDDESTGEEFLAEFLDDYFAESDEHLTAVRRILLELEPESGVAGISLGDARRAVPELPLAQGTCRDGPPPAGGAASHHLESYLRRFVEPRHPCRGRRRCADCGTNCSSRSRRTPARATSRRRSMASLARLSALVEARSERPAGFCGAGEQWIVRFAPSPELVARGITVDRIRTRLREHGR